MLVVSHDDKLLWVVSLLLLHLHRLPRMRVMMALAMMVLMRTIVLARPVIIRFLSDVLSLCQKGE